MVTPEIHLPTLALLYMRLMVLIAIQLTLVLRLSHLLAFQVRLSTLTLHPMVHPLILAPNQSVVPALLLMPL